jgi:hypothetical protein
MLITCNSTYNISMIRIYYEENIWMKRQQIIMHVLKYHNIYMYFFLIEYKYIIHGTTSVV